MKYLFLLICVPTLFAHKFHASLTTLDCKTNTTEITIRLFSDDLENILSKRAGEKVSLDSEAAETATFAYLNSCFKLRLKENEEPLTLTWVGMEYDVHNTWVYLEAPANVSKANLENRIFFDLFPDQMNTVNLKENKSRRSFVYKKAKPIQQF